MAGLGLHRDPAQLSETVDPGLAAETAVAGVAHAAKGHLRLVMHGGTVDVAHARPDLPCDAQPPRRVAGEDRGGEAIVAVVGDADRVRLVPRADHRGDGAEAFVAIDAHRRWHAVDHRGGHPHAVAPAPG